MNQRFEDILNQHRHKVAAQLQNSVSQNSSKAKKKSTSVTGAVVVVDVEEEEEEKRRRNSDSKEKEREEELAAFLADVGLLGLLDTLAVCHGIRSVQQLQSVAASRGAQGLKEMGVGVAQHQRTLLKELTKKKLKMKKGKGGGCKKLFIEKSAPHNTEAPGRSVVHPSTRKTVVLNETIDEGLIPSSSSCTSAGEGGNEFIDYNIHRRLEDESDLFIDEVEKNRIKEKGEIEELKDVLTTARNIYSAELSTRQQLAGLLVSSINELKHQHEEAVARLEAETKDTIAQLQLDYFLNVETIRRRSSGEDESTLTKLLASLEKEAAKERVGVEVKVAVISAAPEENGEREAHPQAETDEREQHKTADEVVGQNDNDDLQSVGTSLSVTPAYQPPQEEERGGAAIEPTPDASQRGDSAPNYSAAVPEVIDVDELSSIRSSSNKDQDEQQPLSEQLHHFEGSDDADAFFPSQFPLSSIPRSPKQPKEKADDTDKFNLRHRQQEELEEEDAFAPQAEDTFLINDNSSLWDDEEEGEHDSAFVFGASQMTDNAGAPWHMNNQSTDNSAHHHAVPPSSAVKKGFTPTPAPPPRAAASRRNKSTREEEQGRRNEEEEILAARELVRKLGLALSRHNDGELEGENDSDAAGEIDRDNALQLKALCEEFGVRQCAPFYHNEPARSRRRVELMQRQQQDLGEDDAASQSQMLMSQVSFSSSIAADSSMMFPPTSQLQQLGAGESPFGAAGQLRMLRCRALQLLYVASQRALLLQREKRGAASAGGGQQHERRSEERDAVARRCIAALSLDSLKKYYYSANVTAGGVGKDTQQQQQQQGQFLEWELLLLRENTDPAAIQRVVENASLLVAEGERVVGSTSVGRSVVGKSVGRSRIVKLMEDCNAPIVVGIANSGVGNNNNNDNADQQRVEEKGKKRRQQQQQFFKQGGGAWWAKRR